MHGSGLSFMYVFHVGVDWISGRGRSCGCGARVHPLATRGVGTRLRLVDGGDGGMKRRGEGRVMMQYIY